MEPSALDAVRTQLRGPVEPTWFAELLEATRQRVFLDALSPEEAHPWAVALTDGARRGDFTLPKLLEDRASRTPTAEALETEEGSLTFAQAMDTARTLGRALLHLLGDEPEAPVALLSENSLEAALVDLACLASGIEIASIPPQGPVAATLRHSRARVLVVSSSVATGSTFAADARLRELRAIATLPSRAGWEAPIPRPQFRRGGPAPLRYRRLMELGAALPDAARAARAAAARSDDLATTMYTSGSGGEPKAIGFSQLNLVSKRICRSLALPPIGVGDRLLAYLPLCHTFGRWFEFLGAFWWGATYRFARSSAREALIEDFARARPTFFVSVPSKWAELCEEAAKRARSDEPGARAEALREMTGGRLRFGLSAAGFLEPERFHEVRHAGIALCSGYGMTEATGGITMTRPERYIDGSVGVPLPGLETHLDADGELRIRGPYVMRGYVRGPSGDSGLDRDGWFATGDCFEPLGDGHLKLVGRKKELFKNRKGRTIAPQPIERLFLGAPGIAHVCLIGDGRDCNTLLLSPREPGEATDAELAALGLFVADRNRALPPFERIVDFRRLATPWTPADGELTPKGSLRREAIERRHRDAIERMYSQSPLTITTPLKPIVVPSWVLRETGAPRSAVTLRGRVLAAGRRKLAAYEDPRAPGMLRLGDYAYDATGAIDLGRLLSTPALWLGNEGLCAWLASERLIALAAERRSVPCRVCRVTAARPDPRRLRELHRDLLSTEPLRALHAAALLTRGEGPDAVSAWSRLRELRETAALPALRTWIDAFADERRMKGTP